MNKIYQHQIQVYSKSHDPIFQNMVQTNLYIKGNQGNLKFCPLWAGANYMHSSLNGEKETVLYIQWFVIFRCAL